MNVFPFQRSAMLGVLLWLTVAVTAWSDSSSLESQFLHPPPAARPWVIWFWVDGNISREGITADLEAMQRVGIGGALLMDVTQELPPGPVRFNSPEWRASFRHAAAEAQRLGLELALNNGPGWSGSGGPWITPELSMQKVVWSQTNLTGPSHFEGALAPLQIERGYLQPIATVAIPTLPSENRTRGALPFRIPAHQAKTGLSRAGSTQIPNQQPPPGSAIAQSQIIDLTSLADVQGKLKWDVPAGNWSVLRFGATSMGTENHPVVPEGLGLECDKLAREAIEVHFQKFLAPLIDGAPQGTNGGFKAIHVDSWEIGFQNWTPHFREEFARRRGYDLLKFLPAYTGRVVDSLDVSERFLWDVRRTVADLEADNYAGQLARLAHERRLQLSIEAYANGPFDQLLYASRADLPMGEFWTDTDDFARFHFCKSMASAAHVYGKPIVPAEAFTSYPATARWNNSPASLKSLADAAFCQGVNRLAFHCYTHQPWLDRAPGMTMGRFGLHYERTETWWEQSRAWHEYLARCQSLLQAGQFVADVCYLTEEGAYTDAPTRDSLNPPLPDGYDYDVATPEAVLTRMTVVQGRLTLPDGQRYRLLVLPRSRRMTPALLERVARLAAKGAAIIGPVPTNSPSLTQFPACDAEVSRIAHALSATGGIPDVSVSDAFRKRGLGPDFRQLGPITGLPLRWIHRQIDEADVYFIANSNAEPVSATCALRVTGKWPELWHPDTGQIEKPANWRSSDSETQVRLRLEPAGSCFVVLREPVSAFDNVIEITRNGQPDPAADISLNPADTLELGASENGNYEVKRVSGRVLKAQVTALPPPLECASPWKVRFEAVKGAPAEVTLPRLISWSDHSDPAVRYFSGHATYVNQVTLPPELFTKSRRLILDLGDVEVIAEVRLNGRDLGILWKPPFTVDITGIARPGQNELEIRVTNLWPNRLIGDEQLPDDCQWRPFDPAFGAALAEFPQWFKEGKPSPTGRSTFATWKHWTKDSSLLKSGLLGPVKIRVIERLPIDH